MALRALVRSPGTSLLAVVALALGLAAPATFFSFLVGATRALPVPEGDRVVRVEVVQPSRDGRSLPVRERDLVDLRGASGLEGLGGFRTYLGTLVDEDLAAARVSAAVLTPDVLSLLRVPPTLGRLPDPDEGGVLLGHDLWEDLYDGDPGVLGRMVRVDGAPLAVVGVMPEGFGFPFRQNLWTVRQASSTGEETVELVGRLADGASLEAARPEIAERWRRGDPQRAVEHTGGVAQVRPYTGGRGEGGEAVAFGGLVLVALCLLVIACSNVANLLLVRATERVGALAIQAAIGAGRLQISFQLLSEAVLLALFGGLAGLGMAVFFVGAVERSLAAEHFGYFWMRMAVDGSVLAFTGVLVVGTALLAGLIPVARVLKVDVHRVLKEEGSGGAVGGGGAWGRTFVTGQLALSCAALVAAGLTGLALSDARDFGRGLPGEEVLIASVNLGTIEGQNERQVVIDALVAGLGRKSGVEGSAAGVGAPGYSRSSPLLMAGASEEAQVGQNTQWNGVSPEYFAIVDLELRAGRAIERTDGADAQRVAWVSESFVRRFSPDQAVLGRRIRLEAVDSAWHTVVGVVEDADLGGGELSREDRVYLPLTQVATQDVMLLARSAQGGGTLAAELRRSVAEVDASLPVWGVRTLADAYAYMIRVPRAFAALALGGGAAGFLVAAVGLYGLLAFRVRQRRSDLGVRLALGADGARLGREVVMWAMWLLVPAVFVGLVLAWVVSPVLAVALFGADPRAPEVYGLVGATFLGVGMLAALGPALRAAATDPVGTLRRQ
jgi:predicted permease